MTDGVDLIAQLDRRLAFGPPYALVDEASGVLEDGLGAKRVVLHLADYSGTSLERLEPGEWPTHAPSMPIAGTMAGLSHVEQRIVVEGQEGVWRVLAPVTIRDERLGVLEIDLGHEPVAECEALLGRAASTVAAAIVAARPNTDLFHRVRRRRRPRRDPSRRRPSQ